MLDWERTKSERIHDTTAYTNLSALGEILLGYPNEYGKYTDRPLLDPRDDPDGILPLAEDVPGRKDLGRNGTYLVLRDLSQDVPAFWRFINEQASRDREDLDTVAAATVGRMPSDIPIAPDGNERVHNEPDATSGGYSYRDAQPRCDSRCRPRSKDIRRNQFTFHADVDGTACPFGAHIRRANPRNADLPEGTRGLFARLIRILGYGRQHPHDDLIASTRFHRILRRGREYVLEAPARLAIACVQRGLRFICLNANISRQFEFIQASWLANPKFEGLDEGDPLVANRVPLATGRRATRSRVRSRTDCAGVRPRCRNSCTCAVAPTSSCRAFPRCAIWRVVPADCHPDASVASGGPAFSSRPFPPVSRAQLTERRRASRLPSRRRRAVR